MVRILTALCGLLSVASILPFVLTVITTDSLPRDLRSSHAQLERRKIGDRIRAWQQEKKDTGLTKPGQLIAKKFQEKKDYRVDQAKKGNSHIPGFKLNNPVARQKLKENAKKAGKIIKNIVCIGGGIAGLAVPGVSEGIAAGCMAESLAEGAAKAGKAVKQQKAAEGAAAKNPGAKPPGSGPVAKPPTTAPTAGKPGFGSMAKNALAGMGKMGHRIGKRDSMAQLPSQPQVLAKAIAMTYASLDPAFARQLTHAEEQDPDMEARWLHVIRSVGKVLTGQVGSRASDDEDDENDEAAESSSNSRKGDDVSDGPDSIHGDRDADTPFVKLLESAGQQTFRNFLELGSARWKEHRAPKLIVLE